MVKSEDQIKEIVSLYVKEVEKDYNIEQVILFGSYASGKANELSDIDLVIVSPDFRGKPEMDILEDLSRKAMKINTLLEVLALTPEDLESPDPRSFSYQVKKYGMPIAA